MELLYVKFRAVAVPPGSVTVTGYVTVFTAGIVGGVGFGAGGVTGAAGAAAAGGAAGSAAGAGCWAQAGETNAVSAAASERKTGRIQKFMARSRASGARRKGSGIREKV